MFLNTYLIILGTFVTSIFVVMKQVCNILSICNRNFRKPKPDDTFGGVFDTTSSNTGKEEGPVVPLERLLDKKLVRLSCLSCISNTPTTNYLLQAVQKTPFPKVKRLVCN